MPKATNIAVKLFEEVLTRFEEAALDRYRSIKRERSGPNKGKFTIGVEEDARYVEKSKALVAAFTDANNVYEEVEELPRGHSINFIHMPNGQRRITRVVYEDGGRVIERYERNGRTLAEALAADEVRMR